MKNYRDKTPKLRCANCHLCFTKTEYDEYDEYFCTDNAEKRPLSGSVAMDEDFKGSDDEWELSHNAWEKWAAKNKVGENGFCDNYESGGIAKG